MPGHVLRSACSAVLTSVAFSVLTLVPLAPGAAAEPTPSAPSPSTLGPSAPGTDGRVPDAAPAGGLSPTPVPGGGPVAGSAGSPTRTDVLDLLAELRTLYGQAERADSVYRSTHASLVRQQTETARAGGGLDRARSALARTRRAAGQLARTQYRGAPELSGYLQLLLADDPMWAVEQQRLLARAARGTRATEVRLIRAEKRAHTADAASRAALRKQHELAAREERQRDTAESKMREVSALLAGLTPDQLGRLLAGSQAAAPTALPTPAAPDPTPTDSDPAPVAPATGR